MADNKPGTTTAKKGGSSGFNPNSGEFIPSFGMTPQYNTPTTMAPRPMHGGGPPAAPTSTHVAPNGANPASVPVRTSSAPPMADNSDAQPRGPIHQPYKMSGGGYNNGGGGPRGGGRGYNGGGYPGQQHGRGGMRGNAAHFVPRGGGGGMPRHSMQGGYYPQQPMQQPRGGMHPQYGMQMQHYPPYAGQQAPRPQGGAAPVTTPSTGASEAVAAAPKARKAIEIIDPKTGKPIQLSAAAQERQKKSVSRAQSAMEVAQQMRVEKSTLRATSKDFSPSTIPSPVIAAAPAAAEKVPPIQEKEEVDPSIMFGSFAEDSASGDRSSPEKKAVVEDSPQVKVVEEKLESAALEDDDSAEESWENEAAIKVPIGNVDTKLPSNKWNEKITYTAEELLAFKDKFTDLPAKAKEPSSGWDTMEIAAARPRGSSRGHNNSGWERGHNKGGGKKGGGEWARSQDVPRRQNDRRGRHHEPEFDGPVKPLERTETRWVPIKSTSNLDKSMKAVQSIMNKMTREKYDRLAAQLGELQMYTLDTLKSVINLIFDKAICEPHFCDMYADLCVHLQSKWKVWSFLKIIQSDADKHFYYAVIGECDADVIGPFNSLEGVLNSVDSDNFEPVPAPENLTLSETRIRNNRLVKVWSLEGSGGKLYWSGDQLDSLTGSEEVTGPFENEQSAKEMAARAISFKRLFLSSCQDEFLKDNVYEEYEQKLEEAKKDGKTSPEALADIEEQRTKLKRRMLGNIRFIGELYKKGMLQVKIMHECIVKLLDHQFLFNEDGQPIAVEPLHPDANPDEERLESLSKLLTTIGKTLEEKTDYYLNMYFKVISALSVDKRVCTRIRFMLKDVIDLRKSRWVPRRKELKQKTLDEIRKDAQVEQQREQRQQQQAFRNGPSQRGDNFRGRDSRGSFQGRAGGGGGNRNTNPPGRPATQIYGRQHSKNFEGKGRFSNRQQDARRKSTTDDSTIRRGKDEVKKSFIPLSEELTTGVLKIIKEFAQIEDMDEAFTCIGEIVDEQKGRAVAKEAMKFMLECKDSERSATMKLIEEFVNRSVISKSDLEDAIGYAVYVGPDLKCDVPKFHNHLANLLLMAMKFKEPITFKWFIYQCGEGKNICVKGHSWEEVWENFVDSGLLADVVAEYLKSDNGNECIALLKENYISIPSLLPEYLRKASDVAAWLSKHSFDSMNSLLGQAFELSNMVQDKASQDEIVNWIQANGIQTNLLDPYFSQHVFLFIAGLSFKSGSPSDMHLFLLQGTCGGDTDRGVASLFALEQCANSKTVLKLLSKLCSENVITKPSLKKWKSMPHHVNIHGYQGDVLDAMLSFN